MGRQKYIIVMAGGSGRRMGGDTPKQFLEIKGKAILHRTLQKFIDAFPDIRIITVLPSDHIPYWKKYCIEHNFFYPQSIVPGGITRFHSVKNGLEKVPEGALVGVHDGVRPLVSVDLIRTTFGKAESHKAVIPILPCTDTLKAVAAKKNASGEEYYETIPDLQFDRSIMFGAQTPQVFYSELLKDAYNQAYATSFTDDASVVAARGSAIFYTKGERLNLKITTPDDMLIADALTRY